MNHSHEHSGWKENALGVLDKRIRAVDLFASPESAQAANAAQRDAQALYISASDLFELASPEISDEQNPELTESTIF